LQNDIDKGVDDDEAIEEWAAADIDGNGRESLSLVIEPERALFLSAPNGPSPNTFHAAGTALQQSTSAGGEPLFSAALVAAGCTCGTWGLGRDYTHRRRAARDAPL
jgi:hypothetical protein